MKKTILKTPRHFNFDEILRFLNRSSKECLHEMNENSVRKLIPFKTKPILVDISQDDPTALILSFPQEQPTKNKVQHIITYVSDWLDLDTDLEAFYKMANKNTVLKPLIQPFLGLRIIGLPDLFEALSWAIIGQQINLNFAYSLKQRLVEKYGQKIMFEEKTYYLFPTVSTIAALNTKDLRPLQFSERKAEYLIGLAQKMRSPEYSKEELMQLPFEKIYTQLIAIRGIGNWTANYVLMKCFLDRDAFPIEDAGLHNALKQQLKMDRKPTIEEIKKLAEPWAGWRAYAVFYLWQSLLQKNA